MNFMNDEEHIKTALGQYRFKIKYKQCVRCRTKQTAYRNNSIEHARGMDMIHYENNKEQKFAYKAELVECDESLRSECLKQHKLSMNCNNSFNQYGLWQKNTI